MKEYFMTTIYKEEEPTPGMITDNTLVNGKIIKWKVKEFLFGLMAEFIKEIIEMTKRKGLDISNGTNYDEIFIL
jgi:hypothetical protein